MKHFETRQDVGLAGTQFINQCNRSVIVMKFRFGYRTPPNKPIHFYLERVCCSSISSKSIVLQTMDTGSCYLHLYYQQFRNPQYIFVYWNKSCWALLDYRLGLRQHWDWLKHYQCPFAVILPWKAPVSSNVLVVVQNMICCLVISQSFFKIIKAFIGWEVVICISLGVWCMRNERVISSWAGPVYVTGTRPRHMCLQQRK